MKRIGIFVGLAMAALAGQGLKAQADCSGGRYMEEIFPNVSSTLNITYGQNYNLQGTLQSLELDVYEPDGDTLGARPLIVIEHGGSFLFGDKGAPDMVELAEPLARMGFVVASVEYRLGMEGIPFPGTDSSKASEAVWRAVADFKAAVRFFKKDVIQSGNTYRIDTNRIFIGGVSAGAVSALHYAYLDDINEMPSYIDTTKQGLGGGIEGSSGNPGYSSSFKAVVNLCGMIADTAWIQPGDEPIVSLHGTVDDVVPYATDIISVMGIYQIFEVDGSHTVHEKANQVGVNNCLYTWDGAGHTPEIGSAAYTDTALNVIKHFLIQYVCSGGGSCGYVVGLDNSLEQAVQIYPNPTATQVNVAVDPAWGHAWNWRVMDLQGRILKAGEPQAAHFTQVSVSDLPDGIYLMELQSDEQRAVKRLVIQH